MSVSSHESAQDSAQQLPTQRQEAWRCVGKPSLAAVAADQSACLQLLDMQPHTLNTDS